MSTIELIQANTPNRTEWPAWTFPGGYAIGYLMEDGESICGRCVADESNPVTVNESDSANSEWNVVDAWSLADVDNPEDERCAHCGFTFETASIPEPDVTGPAIPEWVEQCPCRMCMPGRE
jgi:hypothetical protein